MSEVKRRRVVAPVISRKRPTRLSISSTPRLEIVNENVFGANGIGGTTATNGTSQSQSLSPPLPTTTTTTAAATASSNAASTVSASARRDTRNASKVWFVVLCRRRRSVRVSWYTNFGFSNILSICVTGAVCCGWKRLPRWRFVESCSVCSVCRTFDDECAFRRVSPSSFRTVLAFLFLLRAQIFFGANQAERVVLQLLESFPDAVVATLFAYCHETLSENLRHRRVCRLWNERLRRAPILQRFEAFSLKQREARGHSFVRFAAVSVLTLRCVLYACVHSLRNDSELDCCTRRRAARRRA